MSSNRKSSYDPSRLLSSRPGSAQASSSSNASSSASSASQSATPSPRLGSLRSSQTPIVDLNNLSSSNNSAGAAASSSASGSASASSGVKKFTPNVSAARKRFVKFIAQFTVPYLLNNECSLTCVLFFCCFSWFLIKICNRVEGASSGNIDDKLPSVQNVMKLADNEKGNTRRIHQDRKNRHQQLLQQHGMRNSTLLLICTQLQLLLI